MIIFADSTTWLAFGLSFAVLVIISVIIGALRFYRQRRFEEALLASAWIVDLAELQPVKLRDSYRVSVTQLLL